MRKFQVNDAKLSVFFQTILKSDSNAKQTPELLAEILAFLIVSKYKRNNLSQQVAKNLLEEMIEYTEFLGWFCKELLDTESIWDNTTEVEEVLHSNDPALLQALDKYFNKFISRKVFVEAPRTTK